MRWSEKTGLSIFATIASQKECINISGLRPKSAVDIVPIMFRRPLDAHQLSFALGEALAHLNKLWLDGSLQRERGADGIYRFRVN